MIFELTLVFLFMLFVHWIGDFVLQTHWMAVNKSKNIGALALHVAVYTATIFLATVILLLTIGLPLVIVFTLAFMYAIVNGIIHFGVDAITSRITSRLFRVGRYHDFFVVVGMDQLIHYGTLIGTAYYMYDLVIRTSQIMLYM